MLENYLENLEPDGDEFERLYEAVRSTTDIYAKAVKHSLIEKYSQPSLTLPASSAEGRNLEEVSFESLQLEQEASFRELQESFRDLRTCLGNGNGALGSDGVLLKDRAVARCESALQRYKKALRRSRENIRIK